MTASFEFLTRGEPVVTLEEVKRRLRVDFTDDDDDLQAMIEEAFRAAEDATGRAFRTYTARLILPCFPQRNLRLSATSDPPIVLPFPPVTAVTSISYYDTANDSQTLASPQAVYSMTPCEVHPPVGTDWPDTYDRIDAVTIEFSGGLDAKVPETIRKAVMWACDIGYDDLSPQKLTWKQERIDAIHRGLQIRDRRLAGITT